LNDPVKIDLGYSSNIGYLRIVMQVHTAHTYVAHFQHSIMTAVFL